MKADPTRPPPAHWPLEHPYLFVYTVINTILLVFLGTVYLADWLIAVLP